MSHCNCNSTMAKTVTSGSSCIPPHNGTHPATETTTKAATKRANSKSAKAGGWFVRFT